MKLNRIFSLLIGGIAMTALLPGCGNTSPLKESKRPNVLFIMSDDHAVQAISAYGHPVSQLAPTPNIDRLANEGAMFTRAYCNNSLCGPSRASILTGKFSHTNGFTRNSDKFDGNQPTFPKYMQREGYETAVIGKWHLKCEPQGFDFWKILNDQGEYYNPDFITKEGTQLQEGYCTDLITDMSIDWLDKQRSKEKPFMMMVHHKAPHRNWLPAERHYNLYDTVQFPVPETYFDDYQNRTAAKRQKMNIYRDMYEGHDLKMTVAAGVDSFRYDPWPHLFDRMTDAQKKRFWDAYRDRNEAFHKMDLDEEGIALWKYQRYMQDYMATIASVDENIGRLLDYLDETGLAENTIVIYTSDQGFYLGEHGWFDKRFMYEESFRMPLFIRYPKQIKAGTSINKMVQNIDYAETILDYCNIDIPEDMQGRSVKPLLAGEDVKDWRDALYYHYYEFPGFHAVKRQYGVKTDRYKLIHFYHNVDQWELYDLHNDPLEINNIYGKKGTEQITSMMMKKLDELQLQYGDTIQ